MKPPLDTSLAYRYFMSYRLMDGERFDETVIPYNHNRGIERSLSSLLKRFDVAIFVLLALVCLAIMVLAHSPWAVLIAIGAAALIPLAMYIRWCAGPTHIAVSSRGMRLYYVHWFGDKTTPFVPWTTIERAVVSRSRSRLQEEQWLEMIARDQATPAMSLRVSGIATAEHRRRLLAAVKRNLSPGQIEVGLQDLLNPVRLDSHTTIWLDVLSSSPRRLRGGRIEDGAVIGNGRYRIEKSLGAGGQGTAYLVSPLEVDGDLVAHGSSVVLKEFVLPAEASYQVCARALATIQQEADLLRSLSHPQVVRLLDMFVDDQRAYLVLEHVPGDNLRRLVEENGLLGERPVADLGLQMCEVLSHLHGQNPPIIHRDFTPDNLILCPDGVLKLIDFNVAQKLESKATRTVVGKHAFIAPEQFRGRACIQSDIYSLGACMYFLLTGAEPEPIERASLDEQQEGVSAPMKALIERCTEFDTEERFKTSREVKMELELLLSRLSR